MYMFVIISILRPVRIFSDGVTRLRRSLGGDRGAVSIIANTTTVSHSQSVTLLVRFY